MDAVFNLAMEKSGREYLEFEFDLRRRAHLGSAEIESLGRNLAHPDPVARLLTKVILDWSGPRENDFKLALAYLDQLPIKLGRTAMGAPSPTGTESYLTLHFADRVAELLALRLVKEEGWPHWKVVAVILYLKAHKVPSTTSALIRFGIDTTNAEWREFALEAIHEIKDPELGAKLTFEFTRAKRLERMVPAEIKALAN